jgi:Flp pilus assembly protein TadB
MGYQPPPRPEWLDDRRQPLPRASGLNSNSKTPFAASSLPRLVLLVLLPILIIGFFFSFLFHVIIVAVILALLAVATVVRLALTRPAGGAGNESRS